MGEGSCRRLEAQPDRTSQACGPRDSRAALSLPRRVEFGGHKAVQCLIPPPWGQGLPAKRGWASWVTCSKAHG